MFCVGGLTTGLVPFYRLYPHLGVQYNLCLECCFQCGNSCHHFLGTRTSLSWTTWSWSFSVAVLLTVLSLILALILALILLTWSLLVASGIGVVPGAILVPLSPAVVLLSGTWYLLPLLLTWWCISLLVIAWVWEMAPAVGRGHLVTSLVRLVDITVRWGRTGRLRFHWGRGISFLVASSAA